ncbi:MAG TPA: hypothetical protein VJW94_03645 [Candidatus Acidoferrum sp.]|nr:hypothetical protein [Candidatus Acidoferrum sp.]
MKHLLVIVVLVTSLGWAQIKAPVPGKSKPDASVDFTKSQPQPSDVGRYQIVFAPDGKDVYLLDTSAGRVWLRGYLPTIPLEGGGYVSGGHLWQYEERFDDSTLGKASGVKK